MSIQAFRCWVAEKPEWSQVVNHATIGKAKAEYWREVVESWENIPYTAIRAQAIGRPVTTNDFARCMTEHRGLPEARCGQRVSFNSMTGTIVGHNDACNLEVLVDEGQSYGGQKVSVHPSEVVFLPAPLASKGGG